MKRRKGWRHIRAGALPWAASAFLGLTACGRGRNPETDDRLPPQVALHGVTLHAWRGSELAASGSADSLTYDRRSGNVEAARMRVRFPPRKTSSGPEPNPTSELELTAAIAHGNLLSRQADATGGVIIRTSSGVVARTRSARFDGLSQMARGTEPVEVIGPGYELDAAGFTFDLPAEELVFEKDVKSQLGAVVTPR